MKRYAIVAMLGLLATACGGADGEREAREGRERSPRAGTGELTAEQLENGIGPITSVTLAPIDPALAAAGQEIFVLKCSACHKPDERYVGPALGDVTTRRTPEYVMNMMLNPEEMVQRHPEAKALLAQFMAPMPNQSLTRDDARAVLEYLRTLADQEPETGEN